MELKFLSKKNLIDNIWEYEFSRPAGFSYDAGDYIEMGITNVGSHWLSMASAPTEENLLFTLKIRDEISQFKSALQNLSAGDSVYTSPAIGNFNLPRVDQKVLFIALGIGITPFRSMLVAGLKNPQNAILLYAAREGQHIYETEIANSGVNYIKQTARFEAQNLQNTLPDLTDRIVYLSGPQGACMQIYTSLVTQGFDRHKIKLEYFPGYIQI